MNVADKFAEISKIYCDVIRKKHYSIRTEQACVEWIKRFVSFHKRYPKYLTEKEIKSDKGNLPLTHAWPLGASCAVAQSGIGTAMAPTIKFGFCLMIFCLKVFSLPN